VIFVFATITICSHAGKGNGVFKSTFRHDSCLSPTYGYGGINTTPQANVQLQQLCTQTKRE
jgi:hypothetical protein